MYQVQILLATYNGEKYIAQMLDSILAQRFTDWHLIVSDDMSKDSTADILQEYALKYPQRITFYRSGMRFGNAQNHFMHLLEKFHDAAYIMFCDQDDVWHTDKIEKTVKKMREVENGDDVATLVHTDLRVVDANMQCMDPSFLHFSKLNGNRMKLNHLLVQNVATGCTMMLNHALVDLVLDHKPEGKILMHDWWIALTAAALGKIGFLDEATMDYRQHGNNVVGAKNTRDLSYILKKIQNDGVKRAMQETYKQARVFEETFSDMLCEENRVMVHTYASLAECGFLRRRMIFAKYRFWKNGIQRIAAQIIWG